MGLLQWATVFLLLALVAGVQGFGSMARGKTSRVTALAKLVSGTFLAIAVMLFVLVVFGIRPTA